MRKFGTFLCLMLVSLAAVFVLTTHRAAADPDCFVLGDPSNGKNTYNSCTDGQDEPDEYGLSNLVGGGSSSELADEFIDDINAYASKPYMNDQVGAQYIMEQLQKEGGNWEENVRDSDLQVTGIPGNDECINTAYVPGSGPGAGSIQSIDECAGGQGLVMSQGGRIVFILRIQCGNVMGNLPGPAPPPTGNFAELVCNANPETYTIEVRFGDPGSTSAELRSSGGKVLETANGTSATWTISTKTLVPGNFSVQLWVEGYGSGGAYGYQEEATHALANCNPVGTITAPGNCYEVALKLWDPNDPDDNIKYDLSINGSSYGPYTFDDGQNGATHTSEIDTDYSNGGTKGFNFWGTNKVELIGIDNQTGGQTDLGTVTLTSICGYVNCGVSSLTGPLTAGVPIKFNVSMYNESHSPNPPPNGPPGASFTSVNFETLNDTNVPYVDAGGTLTSSQVSYTPIQSGEYTPNWTFGGGESQPPSKYCPGLSQIEVAYEPYFTVQGGDVSAGEGFDTATGLSCTDPTGGSSIEGENTDVGGAGTYFGSSTRQAAIASGEINQFATDTTLIGNKDTSTNGISGTAPDRPSALAIANTTQTGETYGGGYRGASAQSWCVPNYASAVNVTNAAPFPGNGALDSLTPNPNGYVYQVNGDLNGLGGFTLPQGVRVTLIVSGNVYVNGDIKYNNSYTSVQNIPQFNLMTTGGGNVYIDPGVDELQGFYDAQPNASGANGIIYTCATGIDDSLQSYTGCDGTTLTIYGAVSAAEIVPGRTIGNLAATSAVTDNVAEQFIFTPELWLGSISGPNTGCATDPGQTACMYQSYTSLPPVL